MQALLVVLALPLQTNRAALTTTSPGGGEMLWEVTHRIVLFLLGKSWLG